MKLVVVQAFSTGIPSKGCGYLRVLVLVGWLWSNVACWAQGFSVHLQGLLVESKQAVQGSIATSHYAFEVDVDDCRWFFRLTPLSPDFSTRRIPHQENSFEMTPDEIVASSDTQFFFSYHSSMEHAQQMIGRGDLKAPPGASYVTARRGVGQIPYGIDDKLMALWYAFASHCHFKSAEARDGSLPAMKEMIAEFYQRNNGLAVPGQWRLIAAAPGLPMALLTSNSCNLPNEAIQRYFESKAPNTNVAYEVKQTRTVDGFVIPEEAEFAHFTFDYPEGYSGRVDNRQWMVLTLRVEHAESGSKVAEFVPKLPGPALFDDVRYWKDDIAVAFPIMESWPSEQVVEEVARREAGRRSPPRRGILIMSLLAFLIVFSIFLYKQTTHKANER